MKQLISTMQRYLITFSILFSVLCSCKQKQQKTNHPMMNIVDDKDGENIKVDDFLALTWSEKTVEGKLTAGSGEYDDRPAYFSRRKSVFKGDFFEMLGLLSEGDSAEFKVSLDSLVAKSDRIKPTDTKGKYFIYNVRVRKVVARGNLNDSLYNAAIENYRAKLAETESAREPQKIEKYISENKLVLTSSPLGFKYRIVQQGSGNKPKVNDTVLVNYTGETLTGKVFETTNLTIANKAGIFNKNINYAPAKIPVKLGNNLSAFLQAATMFPKGTKVMLLIPSALAYGNRNYGMLGPYTPLVCNMEIVDMISPSK